MKPRCLILGGLGFIGKNLFKSLLNDGYDTTIIANRADDHDDFIIRYRDVKNKIVIGSILDNDFLAKHISGYDIIFSLAGISGVAGSVKDPYHDLSTNLGGHLNILEACRQFAPNALLFFPSSRLVYGKPKYNPVDEKHHLNPESVYAIHKLTVENYYLMYQRLYQLKSVIFRISNPYGPNQSFENRQHGVLNLLVQNALKNKRVDIFGDGLQQRDFLYVDDLVELFKSSMQTSTVIGKIFNVGYGTGISILAAAQLIAEAVPGTKINFKPWPILDKKMETGDYISDITLINRVTGWKPKIDFQAGIKKTVQFYSTHG